MVYDQEARDEAIREKLEEEYYDFLEGKSLGVQERLLTNMARFYGRRPRTKRIITRNFHRRKEVYESILGHLEHGPQSFTALWELVKGSRSTISSCIQGLCEQKLVRRNSLTRKYELVDTGWSIDPSKINTPSNVYGTRKIKRGRLDVNEHYSVKFFPRKGLVRIDESKPETKAAIGALLDPIYWSYTKPYRKPLKTDFEVEINIVVKGTLVVDMTEFQQKAAKWKEKDKIAKFEETWIDHGSR